MESSSENSFAWTDTSSDSINSTSMAANDVKDSSNETFNTYDGKKRKDKKSRIKHMDESVSSEPNVVIKEETAYYETKSSSLKKNKIKIEPDSDYEIQKNKKKIKSLETNGYQNDSQESISYDETYLDMKVKLEDSSASSSTKHKKKNLKQISIIDSSSTPSKSHQNNSSSEINDVTLKEDSEISKTKKKKKKSKKRYDSDNQDLDVEEKMDIEDTVVENSISKYTDSVVTENTTLQEESEESGCDEISAIKYDDSHSPHAISFINKSIEEETKANCNDSSNIITMIASSVPEEGSNKKLEATTLRKQRISDRLRFEDDDDDDEDTNTVSTHVEHNNKIENKEPLKLKQFLKANPNLKLPPQTLTNNAAFTRDDEIWILKCPTEMNIEDFDNTTLNIHGKCKIKVGGQSYEGNADEEQLDTISLLTVEQNKCRIRNLPLSGIINLRKRIPKAHFHNDNIMVNNQTNFIPLPETKCRHPLFGSNYKKALKIPAAIAERLNVQNIEEAFIRTVKRKKKKNKKEQNAPDQVDPHIQSDITMKTESELSVGMREKKKKKRKLSDDDTSTLKKVKRFKHDPESAEAWESEKAIEENLFNF